VIGIKQEGQFSCTSKLNFLHPTFSNPWTSCSIFKESHKTKLAQKGKTKQSMLVVKEVTTNVG